MASLTLTAEPPLGGFDLTIGANHLIERHDLALVSVAVPLGEEAAFSARLEHAFGLKMPEAARSTIGGDWRAVSMTPDQLLLMRPGEGILTEREVHAGLNGLGYTTHQTDAWAALEISGPDTLSALERICPVNLAVDAFPLHGSARTMMEHLGVLIIRLDATRFLLLSASSSAQSFAHAVETSYRNVL